MAFVWSSQVVGAEVRDSSGQQRIGIIADLLVATSSTSTTTDVNAQSDLRFALVQVDAVPGERGAVIPWEMLQLVGGPTSFYFVLELSNEQLGQAPAIDPNDPRVISNDQWVIQVREFFQNIPSRRQVLRPDLNGAQQPLAQPGANPPDFAQPRTPRQTQQPTSPRGGEPKGKAGTGKAPNRNPQRPPATAPTAPGAVPPGTGAGAAGKGTP